jgi:hypothetical protein
MSKKEWAWWAVAALLLLLLFEPATRLCDLIVGGRR